MWKKIRETPLYLKLFNICIFMSVCIWLGVLFPYQKYFPENRFMNDKTVYLNEGWMDMDGNPLEIPGDYEVEPGTEFQMQFVFSEDVEEEIGMMFYTDHTFVRAYQNGEEIYCFGREEELPFGKTPGSGWQLIMLNQVSEGDVLVITTNSPYEKYSGHIRDILTGTKGELVSHVFWKGLFNFFLALIPLLIGLVIIILPPFFFRNYPISFFFNVGISFMMVSVWSATESRIWQLFFKNAYAMQTLNFLTFLLFMPSVLVTMRMMKIIRNEKLYQKMMLVDVSTALIMIVLQLFEVADFFEMLIVVHVLMLLNELIFTTSFIRRIRARKGFQWGVSILLYAIIGTCITLDLLDFYVWDKFGNGFFSRMMVLMLLIVAGLMAMKRALALHNENIEKKTYEKMAFTDNLTSLKNRRAFDRDIERAEKRKREVTILYADMNGLKYINDHLGHEYGDEALKLIAGKLADLRELTTECYRLGGDEFCMLSYENEPEVLEQKCQEINESLEPYEKDFNYPIGISYGAVRYVPDGELTVQQCMTEADTRMYDFKQALYKKRGIKR